VLAVVCACCDSGIPNKNLVIRIWLMLNLRLLDSQVKGNFGVTTLVMISSCEQLQFIPVSKGVVSF